MAAFVKRCKFNKLLKTVNNEQQIYDNDSSRNSTYHRDELMWMTAHFSIPELSLVRNLEEVNNPKIIRDNGDN